MPSNPRTFLKIPGLAIQVQKKGFSKLEPGTKNQGGKLSIIFTILGETLKRIETFDSIFWERTMRKKLLFLFFQLDLY